MAEERGNDGEPTAKTSHIYGGAASNGVSERRLQVARQTQKLGHLPTEEAAHLEHCFEKYCAGGKTVDDHDLFRVVTEANAGPPTHEEFDTVKRLCKQEAGAGGVISSTVFVKAIERWYIATAVAAADGRDPLAKLTVATADKNGGGAPSLAGGEREEPHDEVDARARALVLTTFARYAKRHEGFILPEELKEMMADLNNGVYPSDPEVQHVMWFADSRQNGYLDVKEFESAVTFWYIHTMDAREQARAHCCTVL